MRTRVVGRIEFDTRSLRVDEPIARQEHLFIHIAKVFLQHLCLIAFRSDLTHDVTPSGPESHRKTVHSTLYQRSDALPIMLFSLYNILIPALPPTMKFKNRTEQSLF